MMPIPAYTCRDRDLGRPWDLHPPRLGPSGSRLCEPALQIWWKHPWIRGQKHGEAPLNLLFDNVNMNLYYQSHMNFKED